jgi:hypothetical protein
MQAGSQRERSHLIDELYPEVVDGLREERRRTLPE